MTSTERHEARYQRRRTARAAQKEKRCAKYDNFDWVFSYEHLYHSYKMCRRGVGWKASVQKYITNAPLLVYETWERLKNGKYKSSGFYEFDVFERGKQRHIKSVTIGERVVQRCLCDYALVPMLERTFIYDNGASLKNKGYSFTVNRLRHHLRKFYRKHGRNGYVLIFDFSKFFDRVSHEIVKRMLRNEFSDEKLLQLTEHFIDAFGPVGMGLGSQISQVLALASANPLDHAIKELMRIKNNVRYMDDGWMIHESKEYLKHCMKVIEQICKSLDIVLNTKKTQIVKLSHGFTFLKIRFSITETGKVIRKIYKRSVTKQRQKLKKLAVKLKQGVVTMKDIQNSMQSWVAYAGNFNAKHTVQKMWALYNELFTTGGTANVLQSNAG